MALFNISRAIPLPKWTTVFYAALTGGSVVVCLSLLRTLAHTNAIAAPHRRQRGGRLHQVYPLEGQPEEGSLSSDIDIIAIHGLDTNSEKTWTWRGDGRKVNWLSDPTMLPSRVERVRIFTYDWAADLLQPSDLVQMSEGEFAALLFEEIYNRVQIAGDPARREDRPIIFIASCLGGIVLMKALMGSGTAHQSVRKATRGIVFLATPFRGTSFQDIAALAEPGLNAWAWVQGREVAKLLTIVKEPTPDLAQLVGDFTALCTDKDHPVHVSTFCEKRKTSLPSKVFPWLPGWLSQSKLLVNEASATLDIFPVLPLERSHMMMNKFAHSQCAECQEGCTESKDFGLVSGKIVDMLEKIRTNSPIQQADEWIRRNYKNSRLKIERLSGDELPLDQCYINLAIVEQPKTIRDRSMETSKGSLTNQSSPFSRSAQLNIETLDESLQVGLPTLFDPRRKGNVWTKPRRIFIRGRAGVGKTTLCKKIVSDFIDGNLTQWRNLFNRVLWVPLRHLKLDERRRVAGYNFRHFLSHEYFSRPDDRPDLANALSDALKAERSKTLFILDGLDEGSQDLSSHSDMFRFIKELLGQPNVIITSRPSGKLPFDLHDLDIELETVGFSPDQVNEYLERTLPAQANEIQSFLNSRPLLQDLVRIPIQLDALCFIWNQGLNSEMKFDTMTTVYRAIEASLWKKDIVRLEKIHEGTPITEHMSQECDSSGIQRLVKDEIYLLECLAFTGLRNDIIEFNSKHRAMISDHFMPQSVILLDKTFPRLSFLRTSEYLPGYHDRSYHFLHLTYQEYFAARYFVRQWIAKQSLDCLQFGKGKGEGNNIDPTTFLQEHKYDPRYDIFWRFVSGLLAVDGKELGFFKTIENSPRDLLGPTHQRLIMRCLSEVGTGDATFTEYRMILEEQLEQWLLFECKFTGDCQLARETEFPEQVLTHVFEQATYRTRYDLLEYLNVEVINPSRVVEIIFSWMKDCMPNDLRIAVIKRLKYQPKALQGTIIKDIEAYAKDKDAEIREAAIDTLRIWHELAEKTAKVIQSEKSYRDILQEAIDLTKATPEDVILQLESKDRNIKVRAIRTLQNQSNLPEKILDVIAVLLQDEDEDIRLAAMEALRFHTDLKIEMLKDIAVQLKVEDFYMRWAALDVLRGQANLSEEILDDLVLLLKDKDEHTQYTAAHALRGQANLPERIIENIAVHLDHNDWKIRRTAAIALEGRTNLKEEILQRLCGLLDDSNPEFHVRNIVIEMLLNQEALSLEAIGPHLKPIYSALLRKSFREHLYWYASDTPFIWVGVRHIPIISKPGCEFSEEFWEVQDDFGQTHILPPRI